jgi:hypothetical protein
LLGVPVRYGTHIVDIRGKERVEAVTLLRPDGAFDDIACDGILFTGSFKPEAALARAAGLEIDKGTGGPAIDQFARTSEPRIFAAGNVLHPVETAGWSWREGRRVGEFVAQDLIGELARPECPIRLTPGTGIRYVVPQRIVRGGEGLGYLQLRAANEVSGALVASSDGRALKTQSLTSGPERRILFPLGSLSGGGSVVTIGLDERQSAAVRSGSACV